MPEKENLDIPSSESRSEIIASSKRLKLKNRPFIYLAVVFLIIIFLSYVGFETDKFDSLIKNKSNTIHNNVKIEFNKTRTYRNLSDLKASGAEVSSTADGYIAYVGTTEAVTSPLPLGIAFIVVSGLIILGQIWLPKQN